MAYQSKSRVNSLQMVRMLPKNGLYYKFLDKKDGNGKAICCILPARMSTKIMKELNTMYEKPTKNDFDRAIAKLFDSASPRVAKLAADGKKPGYDLEFWHIPKVGTIFENVSDKTTFRFAVKMLEARERWIATHNMSQEEAEKKEKLECQIAKAIDRFNGFVEAASFMSAETNDRKDNDPESKKLKIDDLVFNMESYLVDQFRSDSDTSDSEGPIDNDEQEATDDEAPANKRVKVENPFATDGETLPSFAVDLGNAPLTIRTRASMDLDGANKTNAQEPAMPSTNNGNAAPAVAPTGGIEWSENMDRETHIKWYWEQKNSKPASYWDEVLARGAKDAEKDFEDDSDSEMDLDM